ncbi:hypothetical protein [Streptomyces sp. WMMB 714]|uniref:hypothetical protein n=1 Tax=Streptomyces sp. WMMB 714 TaxID=1286822 RepID=UPI00069894F0|nr:hypothetical protein [Streptomyces sp. WMMB 714]
MAWARGHGYGGDLQRKAAREQKSNPNAQYANRLPVRRQRAYEAARTGDGTRALEVTAPNGADIAQNRTGCLAWAQGKLYGDFREWFRVSTVSANLPDHSGDIRRDARFRAAVGQWSACMRGKGLPYRNPLHLQKALGPALEGKSAHEAHRIETRLAVSEAVCARSTPLSATVRALTRKYDHVVRDSYGAEIDTRNKMRLSALKRARDLVRGGTQNAAPEM